MSAVVFARLTATLHNSDGLPFRVQAGQPWRADDPVVLLHPSAFAAEPMPEHIGSSAVGVRAEQATREPGEVRPMRRGRGGA